MSNKIKITSRQIEEIAEYLADGITTENLGLIELTIEQFENGVIKVKNLPAGTYIFNRIGLYPEGDERFLNKDYKK